MERSPAVDQGQSQDDASASRGEVTSRAGLPRGRSGRASADESRNLVHSLSKGLRVLEAFSAERPEMTLSEVARVAGIDPGTAFRMLNTLVTLGYIARVPDSRRFRLTLKVLDLGLNAIGRADLRDLARPILRSLVGEISEAASLGVLDGANVLYVERVRAGLCRLSVDIRIGTSIPASVGIIGHAILAFLPTIDRERISTAGAQGRVAVNPLGKAALNRTLNGVRQRGYALHDSLFGNGLRVLAVPVLDPDGYPVASVSVAAPAVRMSIDEFRTLTLEPVRSAAADIARAVQASGTITTAP